MSESQRVEPRWRCIKEGEVSPYKLALCLFIRETFFVSPQFPQTVYTVNQDENSQKTTHNPLTFELRNISPRTLLLIYRLISTNDMSFAKLKSLIEDPQAQVRPEVLRKFMKIISNLEDGSVGFLYELYHSIIDFKASHIVVLRKKVEKNSPFGKFLRMVMMNVRRMSYPQVHYLYRQLCIYVGDFVKLRKKSIGIIPSDLSFSKPVTSSSTSTPTVPTISKEKDEQTTPAVAAAATATASTSSGPIGILSEAASTPVTSSAKSCKSSAKLSQQPNPYKFRGLEIFQRMTDRSRKSGQTSLGLDLFLQYTTEYKRATGKWSLAQERELQKLAEDKKRRVALALDATKSLRNLWQGNPLLRTASQASLDSAGDHEYSGLGSRPAPKRRSSGRPIPVPVRTMPPRSPRKIRSQAMALQELCPLTERDDGYLPSDDEESMGPPLLPATPKSPRSKSKGKAKQQTKKTLFGGSSQVADTSPSSPSLSEVKSCERKEVPASKKWEQIRWWSRKQIERALKQLANELLNTSKYCYSPKEISTFVEMIVQNPTAQILLSQIYFVEYLNCLRLKDIRRCTEALRTSFDIRIKPNTSELNKGVPYAPYNFAVFYNFMGYKKDALQCLEEAFRAGHAAADPTCLHYCHNMWSCMQNKPYTDAIVTVTKEVDNNMAYLHSLNVIANAFDYHYQKQPPEEVLYTLWHYNAECDLEEMESLLLLSLSSFFMAFGWHEIVTFPCQIMLNSKLRWPIKAYCKALIILADSLQIRGEIEIPQAIMDHGKKLFGYDASPVGELFCLRYAVFQAFQCYLGYKPVPEDILATLHSFSQIEGFYWSAYTKMVCNEWEQASHHLSLLSRLLKEADMSCEINDMKIRCLLLMAELQCLSGAPAAALGHIYEALDIAYSFCADHFITLCLSHIASIQCHMGLATAATSTINKEMRCAIRSTNPWLNARLNVITVKISVLLQDSLPKMSETQLMDKLSVAEEMYKKWGNNYRLKEIYHIKGDLMDKSEDLHQDGSSFRDLCESTPSHLIWNPSTCLL